MTQHGLSLNAEDEQAWPNLYGQQSHSLKYTLQKMHARAPHQPQSNPENDFVWNHSAHENQLQLNAVTPSGIIHLLQALLSSAEFL